MAFNLYSSLLIVIMLISVSCSAQLNDFDRAKKFNDEENYSKAVLLLDEIIAKQPNFDSAYLERAFAYSMIGKFDESFEDYSILIRRSPTFELQALKERGQLYYHLGDYEKAMKDFSEVIKKDPKNFQAYYSRGIAKSQYQNFDLNSF